MGCDGGATCGGGGLDNVCGGAPGTGCVGLACDIEVCAGRTKTTITGTVYDPAGRTPLYNALVYVPNEALAPIVSGASCDRCGEVSGSPIATALSDTHGNFVLDSPPKRAAAASTSTPVTKRLKRWPTARR